MAFTEHRFERRARRSRILPQLEPAALGRPDPVADEPARRVHAGGRSDERAAALVYASTMTFMGASFGGLWLYVARPQESAR
jgi:hypothetical protein